VYRSFDEVQFVNLRQQVYALANTLRNNMQTQISDAESSTLFGHSGGGHKDDCPALALFRQ
jgi:hypothetical protein